MNESYIKKIIRNKIKNNVYINFLIHDYYFFTYHDKEYVNVYVLVPEKCIYIKINDCMPISSLIVNDNVMCFCFEKNSVIDNMVITEYCCSHDKIVTVDKFIFVNYNQYNMDNNLLTILKKLKLNGFKEITVVPKILEEYWICSCGNICLKEDTVCTCCGARKQFLTLYDSEEKIEKKYILEQYKQNKFSSVNVDLELENFKHKILTDNSVIIDKKYLTDDYIESLKSNSNEKIDNYIFRRKNKKLILRYTIIFASIIVIAIVGIFIYKNKKNNDDVKKYISNYCSNTSYKKVDFSSLLNESSCGTIVYYLSKNRLTPIKVEQMIDSDNVDLYEIYYKYKKDYLHNFFDEDYAIENMTYIKYLVDNKVKVSDSHLRNIYAKSMLAGNKEDFTLISKLYDISEEKWNYDYKYFDYGIKLEPPLDEEDNLYEKKDYENIKRYTEYALIYHQVANQNTCTRADLYSVENVKYLNELVNNKVCGHAVTNAMNDDYHLLENYLSAGGNSSYSSYLGNLAYELVYHSSFNEEEYDNFAKALELIMQNNVNINEQMTSDQAYPGNTSLDRFIDRCQDICSDANKSYLSNAYNVKTCNTYKKFYKLLKQYGATCNMKCSSEKYFK